MREGEPRDPASAAAPFLHVMRVVMIRPHSRPAIVIAAAWRYDSRRRSPRWSASSRAAARELVRVAALRTSSNAAATATAAALNTTLDAFKAAPAAAV